MSSGKPVGITIGEVLAHCGGDPAAAVQHVASVIPAMPGEPLPYASLAALRHHHPAEFARGLADGNYASLFAARAYVDFLDGAFDAAAGTVGSLTAFDPRVAWAAAPWFAEPAFLDGLSADGLATAVMRIVGGGHDLSDVDLSPWFTAIEAVTGRAASPEALARLAVLLREGGRIDESLALCDRADAAERVSFTEVVRAGTYRRLGDTERMTAAFERALALDPKNWSLLLDVADARAMRGDFAAAAELAGRGALLEPAEITLRVAAAAYRARHTGAAEDLRAFEQLLPEMPDSPYRDQLVATARVRPADHRR